MANKPDSRQVAAGIAAAVLVAAPIAEHFEGYRGRAYRDPAHILTVCYGDTQHIDPVKIYSQSECAARLRARMAKDFAPIIAACLPEIVGNKYIFGALLDAAYNAGPGRVCSSRMARSIKSGNLNTACNGFYGWFTTAVNRKTGQRIQFAGLERRRIYEARVCAIGANPPLALSGDILVQADYQRCVTINPGTLQPRKPTIYPRNHPEIS